MEIAVVYAVKAHFLFGENHRHELSTFSDHPQRPFPPYAANVDLPAEPFVCKFDTI